MLTREVELTRKLYEQKVVPEIEMLRLQRQAADLAGQIAVLDETIKSAEDRVRRTDLRSPVHGIINKLNVTTVGAVVQPGANLMDIVPLDDTLLVEGRIRPQDIAFIRPDQDAVVKTDRLRFVGLRVAQGQGRAHQRRYHRRRQVEDRRQARRTFTG